MNKRSVFLILFLSASMLVSACALQRIRERATDAPESATTGSLEETTVAPTPEPTANPTSTPTPKPTSGPTSTPSPAPTPTTVYIPPETLPDGQLFEDKYYLILPGEGAIYNVFDCKGEIVETYHALAHMRIGLFEKEQAEWIIQSGENSAMDPYENYYETGEIRYKVVFPGGYIQCTFTDGKGDFRLVTEKETIQFFGDKPDIWLSYYGTIPLSDYTAVYVVFASQTEAGFLRYYAFYAQIEKDGTVIFWHSIEDLPGRLNQVLGEDLVIIEKQNDNDRFYSDLMDLSGNVLVGNVEVIGFSNSMATSFFDYYLKDGIAYDANLKLVPDDTLTSDGRLIPGVIYHVEGIPCSVCENFCRQGVGLINVAYGKYGDNIAIKTEWGQCVIKGTKAALMDVNSTFVLLDDFSVYSFETGEYLFDARLENINFDPSYCLLTEDYIIVNFYSYDNNESCSYVIDKYGNLRYYSEKNYIEATDGPYLFMTRGPYVGLTDLNGDWILKTLNRELTSDGDVFWW